MRLSRRLLWPLIVVGAALAVDRLTRKEAPPRVEPRRPAETGVRIDRVPMEMRPAPPPEEAPPAPSR